MQRTAFLIALLASLCGVHAATYEVGPGKALAAPGEVPWESLAPGDTVLIYWRAAAYQDKWVICRQGTAQQPITVRGVPGPAGELPVIDGSGATTRTALNYWNESRGVIKIGGANNPPDTTPQHIRIENLEIQNGRPPYTYTGANGAAQSYVANAAAIYVEKCEDLIVRNCRLHDCGNGFFVSSNDSLASRGITVERSYIYGNGNVGSIYEHNSYTAAAGILFQYNRFGPLRAGCNGNNLKDRSAGLVVRGNWIEGGNRELDLVDATDSVLLRNDPAYHETFVYGNVIIEPAGDGNSQLVHYGGDSGTTSNYRKGTLYFYQNTIVTKRTDRTTLFRLSTNDESCDFRNNIAYATGAGNTVALVDSSGALHLTHNWMKPGAKNSFGLVLGTIDNDNSTITGTAPGFIDEAGEDFHLSGTSACVNAGAAMQAAVLASNAPTVQYVKHQGGETRPVNGALDIGAFELPPPEVRSFLRNPAGASVVFSTVIGAQYRVDFRDDLANGQWIQLQNSVTGSGDDMTILDPAAGMIAQRFYRVALLTP
jgi:hypothetical protein